MNDENKQTGQSGQGQSDPLAEALKKAQEKAENEKNEAEPETDSKELSDDLQKMTEVAQRALADLANFKRRTEENQKHIIQFANLELMREIIPFVDNFKRALNHLPSDANEECTNWIEGVKQIFKQLNEALSRKGLSEIKCSGEKFDPYIHEAVLQGPGEKDTVAEEMETGYMLNEKVIRPAKVKVGNGEESLDQ